MADCYPFTCETSVCFEQNSHAKLVYDALVVDPELRPNDVERHMSVEDRTLRVQFHSKEARMLRAAVGTFCDLLGVALHTLEAFKDSIKEE
jgi:EKC/KEOPS complex subunit PCC1/LAGE3